MSDTREEQDQGMRNLWRFMSYSRPYWFWVVVGSVTGLGRMVLNLYMPLFQRNVINHVVMVQGLSMAARMHILWAMLPPFLALLVFHAFCTLGGSIWSQVAAVNAVRDIRFFLFDHLQRLSLAFHIRRPTGEIVSRLMNDVGTAQYVFDLVFIQAFQQLLNAGVSCSLMLMHDWRWALVSLSTLPIFLITTRLVQRPMRRASRETLESTSRISGQVYERMAMIREVQAFTAEIHEKKQRAARSGDAEALHAAPAIP